MEHWSGSGIPDPDQIAEWQARADAGDRNAAGRLRELLAGQGDLEGAVQAWKISGAVWEDPASLHAEFLSALSPDEFVMWNDPEDWCFTGIAEERLAGLLAELPTAQHGPEDVA